jgi:uroporphyrin-III C-methyltransferase/precorrin-2 dehydrogenase/sirohydrochlorin ferrochelatase
VTPLLPVFLDLADRDVLLLGAGEAADRRRATLERAGARIRAADRFFPDLLDGVCLAIGAEAPAADLQWMHDEARARGIPVNVVDRPGLSTFITPATVDRLPLQIAISSAGTAPVLARLLRARIETLVDPAYGRLAALADRFKTQTRARFPDVARRRRMLEAALGGRVADLVLAGDEPAAERAYLALLEGEDTTTGLVHFIDPGPGPADLLTLRALRLLGEADVIVHRTDESPSVLEVARRDAARRPHDGDASNLLKTLAEQGLRIVRVSPDPAEPPTLRQAGVTVEEVPGVPTLDPAKGRAPGPP